MTEGYVKAEVEELARIVVVDVEAGRAGLLYATSRTLRGLFVACRSAAEMRESLPLAIRDKLTADGFPCVAVQTGEPSVDGSGTWVALPEAAARAAVAAAAPAIH